jgi:poly-gamma-glutamate synthesis protein (capsule biosynthesis protein)
MSKPDKIIITAVGDVMLGDGPLSPGMGTASAIKKHGGEFIFKFARPILDKGDIVFGNLEAVLAGDVPGKTRLDACCFYGPSGSVNGLKYAGFNVLSVANNHALEYGWRSLTETITLLEANGIKCTGYNGSDSNNQGLITCGHNGFKTAFLSYCLINDSTAITTTDKPSEIYAQIKNARTAVDLVVVSMHWGDEYIQKPSVEQIEMAHNMIDSGASLVLGHHPHVIQGIELYGGGLIAYSLGNFVFDMSYIPATRNGLILECSLNKTGTVSGYNIHPVRINSMFQPVPLEGREKTTALCNINQLSSCILDVNESYSRDYARGLAVCSKYARRKMKLRFLGNITRYPLPFTAKIIADYIGKLLK